MTNFIHKAKEPVGAVLAILGLALLSLALLDWIESWCAIARSHGH